MTISTHDLHIDRFEPLPSPAEARNAQPLSDAIAAHVARSRAVIRAQIAGDDDRLLVVVGPCSIHSAADALAYGRRLKTLQARVADSLFLVMRVYFEKPRTTVGWKGFINDPGLDNSCDMRRGLLDARQILLDLNAMGIPCATEVLDPIVPQYISDLITWAAIGARTTESQTHREMASGLSMPVGFKNATDGSLQLAIDGMTAARSGHTFLGITGVGQACVVHTKGNPDVHLVLRGGSKPNFSRPHLAFAESSLEGAPGERLIMVDCSHGNSGKDPARQPGVFEAVQAEYGAGRRAILGMMVESHLIGGRQNLPKRARTRSDDGASELPSAGSPMVDLLVAGQSITDACIDWETTETLILRADRAFKTGSVGME